jgi:thiamine-phosphate pyrophosphorylase
MTAVTRTDRLDRLHAARLYLVIGATSAAGPLGEVVAAAIEGGCDLVQLRMKDAVDTDIVACAHTVRDACAGTGTLFVLNDRPDLVLAAGADAVHVGQDDMPVAEVRGTVGPDVLVGVSTHAPADLAAAIRDGADYAGVGPVHTTPTKPGRPAAGLDYVTHAASRAGDLPWFAIGGIDTGNVDTVVRAGARRLAVVRAIADAPDLAAATAAARALRAAVADEPLPSPVPQEAPVG